MEIKIYDRKAFSNDHLGQQLEHYLKEELRELEATAYYQEPDYWTPSNTLPTFTIITKNYGILIVKAYPYSHETLTEINDKYWIVNDYKKKNELLDFEDYCYKLKNDIEMPSNEIFDDIPIHSFAIFPFVSEEKVKMDIKRSRTKILFSEYRSFKLQEELKVIEIDDESWKKVKGVFQKSNILNKETNYFVDTPIKNLRDAIAYNNQQINLFDEEQLDASMTITDGAQRIRGLAGSGKTVILSIKAARLHRKDPDAKIAYVFSTHSLYKQVTDLINKYYGKLTGERLNPENLQIVHAWGGKTTGAGFYYNICQSNGIKALTVRDLLMYKEKFDEACKRLLEFDLKEEYDQVLIDEAQDMPLSFFKLVEKVTKKPKNIIWAYDDLQTTNEVKIPDSAELFGLDKNGDEKVPLIEENDYILNKSYRNHKDVLMSAVAFGFGLYSNDGIIQMINDPNTWKALGFKVEGSLDYDSDVKVVRPKDNSPNRPDAEYQKYPILNVNVFENYKDEITNVAEQIKILIYEEKVRPEDIMVVDMYNRAKTRLLDLQGSLYLSEIESIIPGIIDGAKDFFREDSVTLTTVRRAKGNEVPVVVIIGCEQAYEVNTFYRKRILRNMLFISMTRSKGWLFISGNGEQAKEFNREFEKMKDDIYRGEFNFKFPSKEQYESINDLNLLTMDSKKAEKLQGQAELINELLENGDISSLKMFLDEDVLAKLKSELFKGKKDD
ncbi:DEAD/DEAH box helicase [Pseudalkalibacillus sp. Hm43]|uniref:DEAD/DEAH box helicase n=1 Tax=Pseudalkalibacillus sp. Hm43 TaxID=3450742 RepID=UPI003F42EF82